MNENYETITQLRDHLEIADTSAWTYGTDGVSVGMYRMNGEVYAYVGDYQSGLRQGQGAWFQTSTFESPYLLDKGINRGWFVGSWSNDVPSGRFVFETHWISADEPGQDKMERHEGTIADGLWEGEVTETYWSWPGIVLRAHFTKGIGEQQYLPDNPNINLYIYNGEHGYASPFIDDEYDATYGLFGYADKGW